MNSNIGFSILVMGIYMFLFPIYFMGMWYLKGYLDKRFLNKRQEQILNLEGAQLLTSSDVERIVNEAINKDRELRKEDEEKMKKELEEKITINNGSLSDEIMGKMKDEVTDNVLENLSVQKSYMELRSEDERQKIEKAQMRLQLDPEKIESKVKYVAEKVVDRFVRRNYIKTTGHASFAIDFSRADDERRTKIEDIKAITKEFFQLISKHTLYEDLSLLYDLESTKLNEFIVDEFITPSYVELIKQLQGILKKSHKIERAITEKERRDLETIKKLSEELPWKDPYIKTEKDTSSIEELLVKHTDAIRRARALNNGEAVTTDDIKRLTGIDLSTTNESVDFVDEFDSIQEKKQYEATTELPSQTRDKEAIVDAMKGRSLTDLGNYVESKKESKLPASFEEFFELYGPKE